ncbi:MAG: aldo/keto reductase [Microbacteriaceae bacterium]|nr:aldo/keto reductase [Microbacteriaceae bacterium]
MTVPTRTAHDGVTLPLIGLGTYGLNGDEGVAAMRGAIESGYRLIDTAVNYGNEEAVGEVIRQSPVPREELIIATKLPGRHHGFDETMASFEESRRRLGVDRIDLYLIHWPNPSVNRYVDSWQAMIELVADGLVGSIGVCNFTQAMLERLGSSTGVLPSVNQVELHPYFSQGPLREFHEAHGILTQAWSPLGRKSDLLDHPVLADIASTHGVSVTQVVLRWHVQQGIVAIPKSGDAERQRQNLAVFDFALSDADMERIGSLERGRIWGADPDTHEEM